MTTVATRLDFDGWLEVSHERTEIHKLPSSSFRGMSVNCSEILPLQERFSGLNEKCTQSGSNVIGSLQSMLSMLSLEGSDELSPSEKSTNLAKIMVSVSDQRIGRTCYEWIIACHMRFPYSRVLTDALTLLAESSGETVSEYAITLALLFDRLQTANQMNVYLHFLAHLGSTISVNYLSRTVPLLEHFFQSCECVTGVNQLVSVLLGSNPVVVHSVLSHVPVETVIGRIRDFPGHFASNIGRIVKNIMLVEQEARGTCPPHNDSLLIELFDCVCNNMIESGDDTIRIAAVKALTGSESADIRGASPTVISLAHRVMDKIDTVRECVLQWAFRNNDCFLACLNVLDFSHFTVFIQFDHEFVKFILGREKEHWNSIDLISLASHPTFKSYLVRKKELHSLLVPKLQIKKIVPLYHQISVGDMRTTAQLLVNNRDTLDQLLEAVVNCHTPYGKRKLLQEELFKDVPELDGQWGKIFASAFSLVDWGELMHAERYDANKIDTWIDIAGVLTECFPSDRLESGFLRKLLDKRTVGLCDPDTLTNRLSLSFGQKGAAVSSPQIPEIFASTFEQILHASADPKLVRKNIYLCLRFAWETTCAELFSICVSRQIDMSKSLRVSIATAVAKWGRLHPFAWARATKLIDVLVCDIELTEIPDELKYLMDLSSSSLLPALTTKSDLIHVLSALPYMEEISPLVYVKCISFVWGNKSIESDLRKKVLKALIPKYPSKSVLRLWNGVRLDVAPLCLAMGNDKCSLAFSKIATIIFSNHNAAIEYLVSLLCYMGLAGAWAREKTDCEDYSHLLVSCFTALVFCNSEHHERSQKNSKNKVAFAIAAIIQQCIGCLEFCVPVGIEACDATQAFVIAQMKNALQHAFPHIQHMVCNSGYKIGLPPVLFKGREADCQGTSMNDKKNISDSLNGVVILKRKR